MLLTLTWVAISSPHALAATGGLVKRVLILHSFGRDFAPFSDVSSGFRTELARQSAAPIEFLEASLETARFAEGGSETPVVEYLRALFAERRPDLLVPFGAPAMNFLQRHRDNLFPGVPLLIGTVDRRRLKEVQLGANATAVGVNLELPGIVENILRLLPGTTNIEVVIGSSPLERFWLAELRQDFKRFTDRVRFNWLNELSFEEMRKRVAALPRNSVVLYAVLLVDSGGVPHEQVRALEVLRRESNAPIFGAFDSQLGRGIVGGPLYPIQEVSRQSARLAIRIVNGESPGSIPPLLLGSRTPVYDWRELKRWNISETRLPAGSTVQFREPTIWERYYSVILSAIGLLLLQAALIFVLLMEQKRRRASQQRLDERLRYEELVSELSARFVKLPADQIDDQIVESLREVACFLGFDFSTLSVFTGPAVGRVAFIWQAPGTPTIPSDLTEKDFPWQARELFAGRDVSFLAPADLPREAEIDRATVEKIQNRSVHCVPLLAGETPVGVLNVGTFVREQGIAPDLLRRLRLLGEIFANALARKRADESLRASEEQISLAAESANLGVWNWDILNDSIWATEKCRALYGVSPEQEIRFQTFLDTLHESDRERVNLAIESALQGGKDFAEEHRVVLPGGSIRWIGVFGRGSYQSAGEPSRMLGVSIDITERKRMEETLRQEREFLRKVIDVDPNFIFAKDREGRFTLVNQAVANAYGTTVENLIGKTDADFNANVEEVEFFRRLDQEVIDTNCERFIAEERITDAKGKVHWLQTVKRPIVMSDGQASQVLGSATDITRRREAELEAARQRDELAHVTRNATMGELAASLAHELNQPLTAILSNAQAAQRFLAAKPVNLDEVREILIDIVDDNSRAGEIIRRIRALVKKEEPSFARLDLSAVTRDVVAVVHNDAILRNVQVQYQAGDKVPPVRGDRIQLQQVLLNLLLNAFDAMKECRADERQVSVRVESDGAGMVEVSVRDRGTGLTSDKLDRIFEPFFTTKRDGLGMGLSISRSIVDAHGGRLWVENNQDRGATFYFTMPVAG